MWKWKKLFKFLAHLFLLAHIHNNLAIWFIKHLNVTFESQDTFETIVCQTLNCIST